jgi:hypothetical protein
MTGAAVDWTALFITKLRQIGCDVPLLTVPERVMPNGHGDVPSIEADGYMASVAMITPKRVRSLEVFVQQWYCQIMLLGIPNLMNVSITEVGDELRAIIYHPEVDPRLWECLHLWKVLGQDTKIPGISDDLFLEPAPVDGAGV